ncbi:hypothetical protein [Pantoea agglomerans]|uniref:hypothetical protein n=1 Tax=Enterobacter agglomerans TaxID=549 RepID=UPI00244AFEFD|nr:hypothetical protein [Pantoea agglomerans]MDH1171399.1 hypothetical protein [Pantoea agglomerans]
MKLIELLVQELPKRGGWPAGAVEAMSFNHNSGMIHFFDEEENKVIDAIKIDGYKAPFIDTVTTEQYETALAASCPTSWNGEGLPPAGFECEYAFIGKYRESFSRGMVISYGESNVFMQHWPSNNEFIQPLDKIKFRPIRTEAERKRDEFAKSLCNHLDDLTEWDSPVGKVHALAIYDAIGDGKIPHVTLK